MIKILQLFTRRWNIQVTTWNNGSFNITGAGYGIMIHKEFRDTQFDPKWDSILLHIEDKKVSIKLNPTFWSTCNELRSKEIGSYLIKRRLGKWEKGQPHILELLFIGQNEFRLELI